MLRHTILGPAAFWFAIASAIAIPWTNGRSKGLLWGWLAGGLLYAYVVVTVERVDYYMLLLVPLCALTIGRRAGAVRPHRRRRGRAHRPSRYALLAAVPIVALVVLLQSACARRRVLPLRQAGLPRRARTRSDAAGRRAHRDRTLRPRRPVLYQPVRLGGRSRAVDSVRRRERHRQGCALLHFDRRPPPAHQPGAVRLAPALSRPESGCSVAGLRDGSGAGLGRRRRASGAPFERPSGPATGAQLLERHAVCTV